MVSQFGDLKSNAGLGKLNDFLSTASYIGGVVPSGEDACTFAGLTNPAASFKHVQRWFNHIKSFSDAEKKAWTSGSTSKETEVEEEDDDVDLFGSDSEDDEEKEKIKAERLAAYAAKKSKKPGPIAKSSIILDVKPWGDETDLVALEKLVKGISADGLLWGAAKLVPIAYGIKKLQIGCVVEDDKISTDFLEESITAFDEYVQSVDIAAFQKI